MLYPALLTLLTAAPFQSALPSSPADGQDAQQGLGWKDLVKSGTPLRFYGFLRLDAYVNTARMNSIYTPFTVSPEDGSVVDDDDAGFALDPRLTRFGVDLPPRQVGGADVAGKLEIDFANFPSGVSESRATPRIRLAWIDVAGDELALRVGQDWDVVSPIFPAVNGEVVMWNVGNTGDRRPQIQGRWAPKESGFDLKAALGLTGAVSNEDLDSPTGERDGFDAGLPHLQLRAGLEVDGMVAEKPLALGAWGAVGKTETDTSFGGEKRFDTHLVGVDLSVPLASALSLRGEAWTGQNLGDFRGGIGQSINTATGDEIDSVGGWGELAYQASEHTRLHVGSTLDDPDNDDVAAAKPERNFSAYAGTVRDWKCGLRTGLDVIYWDTDWSSSSDGDGLRFNLYFQYNF